MASNPYSKPLSTSGLTASFSALSTAQLTEHQKRIRLFEFSMGEIEDSFPKLAEDKKQERQQLYREAYQRIIDYYKADGELPDGTKSVFTFIGVEYVWRETMENLGKLNKEYKAAPVVDSLAVQAVHNASSYSPKDDHKGRKGKGPGTAQVQMAQNAALRAGEAGHLHPIVLRIKPNWD